MTTGGNMLDDVQVLPVHQPFSVFPSMCKINKEDRRDSGCLFYPFLDRNNRNNRMPPITPTATSATHARNANPKTEPMVIKI